MSKDTRIRLYDYEAKMLNIDLRKHDKNRKQARYQLDENQLKQINEFRKNKITPKKRKFVETIRKLDKNENVISSTEKLQSEPIEVPENFEVIKVSTSKTTGQQWIQYAPKKEKEEIKSFDFKKLIKKYSKKYIKPIEVKKNKTRFKKDFDSLTFTDVHVGMEPNIDNNTMYDVKWNKKELFKLVDTIVNETIQEQESNVLYIDDLGDLLDGLNAQTTRGGHALPQNMTNEEAFDYALQFKMKIIRGLVDYYDKIYINNICNDNHSGCFGYFVNESFKQVAELMFENVKVFNHRQFLNHYIVGDIGFVITHGKDDKSLKFGFKPQLDLKGSEKLDQYCKQKGLYNKCKKIIVKKGDSHQALFDMCTSDDFFYFNYPAASPSSNWIKNNFKLGRRGFVNESFIGLKNYLKPYFIK